MLTKKEHTKIKTKNKLEKQYEKYINVQEVKPLPENSSLEQPYAYKIVQSVTTYGAYDKPV